MDKDRTFLFNLEWMKALEGYSEEVICEVLLGIVRYAERGEQIEMKPLAKMAFSFIKRDMDRLKDWENEQRRKRREAGRIGGLAKKGGQKIETEEVSIDCSTHGDNESNESNAKQTEAMLSNAKQTEANVSYNNNIYSNSNIKENDKKKSDKRFSPPTLEEVKARIVEMGYTRTDPERFINFYESKGWMVGKNKMKDWKAALANWNKDDNNGNKRKGTDIGSSNANFATGPGKSSQAIGGEGTTGGVEPPKNYSGRF